MYIHFLKIHKKITSFIAARIDRLVLDTNIKPQEIKINLDDKCLVIASNPMDECLGMGGFMLSYPKNFEILTMCSGYNDKEYTTSVNSKIVVHNEYKTAMDLLRPAGYKNFDINPGELWQNRKIFEKINIADTDYLFLPNLFSTNKDDIAILKSMAEILKYTECKRDLKIILFEVNSALIMPNFYYDISKKVKIKKELTDCYKTRNSYGNWFENVLGLNKFRGARVRKDYAEAFCVLEIKDFLGLVK